MEAVTEPLTQGAFSMELSQDQRDVREWVHGFAAERRPPGGGRVGRARGDALAADPGGGEDRALQLRGARAVLRRRDRPDAADRQRGAVLGRRRDRDVDHGHDARRRRDLLLRHAASSSASGCRSATARSTSRKVGAFCVSEPDAGSRRVRAAHARPLRRGHRRVGPQRPEGVGDQRRDRQRARRHRLRRSRARRPRPGRLHHPARHARAGAGHEGQEARPARLAHRRRLPRRLPHPRRGCLLGGKEKLDERLARAREGTRGEAAGGDADVRGHAPDASARRRSASPAPPTSTRSPTPRSARSSAARSSRTRRSRSRSPTCGWRSTPPACSSGARRGWAARAASSRPPRAR